MSGGTLTAPAAQALLSATLQLAKELSLDLSEEGVGARFLRTLSALLPGRALCLRVIAGHDGEQKGRGALYCHLPGTAPAQDGDGDGAGAPGAEPGPEPAADASALGLGDGERLALLPEVERGPLMVKRSALRHTGLPEDIATSSRVRLVDRHVAVFHGTSGGFSVPLVAGGELLGMLNCEYPLSGKPAPDSVRRRDEAAVIHLCNQLSVGLRNLRLLHRARSYEGYLRRMVDGASALVAVADHRGRLTIVNRPMEQVSGYRVGAELPELLAAERGLPEDAGRGAQEGAGDGRAGPPLSTLLLAALSGKDCEGAEVLLPSPAGPPVRAVFNVTALRDATGAIDGAAAMGQDLERVRSLERQVLQAERLATIGQLAAGLVHELNNPLSSIVAYGDHLSRRLSQAGEAFSGDAARAQRICESAERLQRLTRDLMAYGRPTGESEPLQVAEVVAQALSFCEHVIARTGAKVHAVYGAELPAVRGVRTQLQQVVVNLVTNACHAIEDKRDRAASAKQGQNGKGHGGAAGQAGQIQVRVTRGNLGGAAAVLVSVQDTGAGIAEGHRARVFEPFFSTKAAGHGTGLGLPIVKNIVEGHGGQVSFETTLGRGTCFLVLLPALRQPEPAERPEQGEPADPA